MKLPTVVLSMLAFFFIAVGILTWRIKQHAHEQGRQKFNKKETRFFMITTFIMWLIFCVGLFTAIAIF